MHPTDVTKPPQVTPCKLYLNIFDVCPPQHLLIANEVVPFDVKYETKMTLLDCAKLSDFVLIKSPRFATIQQEGHRRLIVYGNFGRDCEVMRVKNPLAQATKSTRCCLDTRCKFPLHGEVTADIAAEVLEASNVGQFGTI